MTILKGKVNCRQLPAVLHTALTTEGFTEISSEITNDGRVYRSPSVNGEDLFFIQIKELKAASLQVAVYEKYTPNPVNGMPGTFLNGVTGSNAIAWNNTSLIDRLDVNYIINVNKRRMIVYVEGLRAEVGNVSSLLYIGIPQRISDKDNAGTFAGIAASTYAPVNSDIGGFSALRNRANATAFMYNLDFYMPKRSYGWGKKMFFSPVFIGNKIEGNRGILDGIHIIEKVDKAAEMSAGDTFTQDGKNYMLVSMPAYGNATLPATYDYLIEI